MKTKQPKTILALIIGTALFLGLAKAGAESESSMKDAYEKLWGSAKLYDSKDNGFIQKLAFTGRLQYDYAYVNPDDQQSWDDTAWRRARAGFKATVFQKFTAHIELNLDPEIRQAVRRLHARRRHLLQEPHHHGAQQPEQQLLVHPGILRRGHPLRGQRGLELQLRAFLQRSQR